MVNVNERTVNVNARDFRLGCLILISSLIFAACKSSGSYIHSSESEKSGSASFSTIEGCGRCIILTEQANPSITVVNVDNTQTVWEWQPNHDEDIKNPEWFYNPDEAKPVYNNKYVLITASGGGVALIRFADKKVVFHAYSGGNPHSAELLPDGNIVSASSTGDHLTIFHVDTLLTPGEFYQKKIPIPFGHNVVWDRQRKQLWSAAEDSMYVYKYNFNCPEPDLILKKTIPLPGTGAHDLFPVYGEDALWLTHDRGVYRFDTRTEKTDLAGSQDQDKIKSVSSGPEGFPTIIMKPKEQWWSDEVIDTDGNTLFQQNGMKIYKARWLVDNPFSYPADHPIRTCG